MRIVDERFGDAVPKKTDFLLLAAGCPEDFRAGIFTTFVSDRLFEWRRWVYVPSVVSILALTMALTN